MGSCVIETEMRQDEYVFCPKCGGRSYGLDTGLPHGRCDVCQGEGFIPEVLLPDGYRRKK